MNKNSALLLDRDGVINADTGYVGSIERFSFLPGLFPFLRAARDLGYRLAILTNQAGVARGLYTESDFHRLTAHMLGELKREAIDIELVLACFEHAEAVVPAYARQSFWRKPLPGMVLEALRRLNADPARSAFVGDTLSDMKAAQGGGIRHCLWLTHDGSAAPVGVDPVKTYDEALVFLKARSA
jgi:D-glycero-D-manno-heptose 1,7-bisphosphate phosphatase